MKRTTKNKPTLSLGIISLFLHPLLYPTWATIYFILLFFLLFQVISIFSKSQGVCTSNACLEAPFPCKLYHNYLLGIRSLVKDFSHTVVLAFPIVGLKSRMLNQLNVSL